MADVDEEESYVVEAEGGGEVEGGIAVVGEVRVLEEGGVGFEDAAEEGEVVEVDGAANADGGVDHIWGVQRSGVEMGFAVGIVNMLRYDGGGAVCERSFMRSYTHQC